MAAKKSMKIHMGRKTENGKETFQNTVAIRIICTLCMFYTVFRVYKQAYIKGIIGRWLQPQTHNQAISNLTTQIYHTTYNFPTYIQESYKVIIYYFYIIFFFLLMSL